MNKKELAEMEALRLERDMYRAMHISDFVEPDIAPPVGLGYSRNDFVCGWLPLTYQCGAEKASVGAAYHRTGSHAWDKDYEGSWSQGRPRMYSRKSDALKASRYINSKDYAEKLAMIDREIEKAIAEEKSGS